MQDAHVVVGNFAGDPESTFLGLYDGHGRNGKEIADLAAAQLHELIASAIQEGQTPENALRAAYLQMDQDIKTRNLKGGSTALTVIRIGNTLYVANVGDTRAVLKKGEIARDISEDHALTPAEIKRIEDSGGSVSEDANGKLRVNNRNNNADLAMTRALRGDDSIPGVIAEPSIRVIDLESTDSQLILGCDGLWDEIGSLEAFWDIEHTSTPTEASSLLVQRAFQTSRDNISVFVVNLPQTPPATESSDQPTSDLRASVSASVGASPNPTPTEPARPPAPATPATEPRPAVPVNPAPDILPAAAPEPEPTPGTPDRGAALVAREPARTEARVGAGQALQRLESSSTLETREASIQLLKEQAEEVRKLVAKWELTLLGKVGKDIPERLISPESAERARAKAESGMRLSDAREVFRDTAKDLIDYEINFADLDVVRRAYRKLSRQYHPDINQSREDLTAEEKRERNEKFQQISTAYEVLERSLKREDPSPLPEATPASPAVPPEQPKIRLRDKVKHLLSGKESKPEQRALENKNLQELTIEALTEITASYEALAKAMVEDPSIQGEIEEIYLQNTLLPLLQENSEWFNENNNGDTILQELRKRRTGKWTSGDVKRRLPKANSDADSWESRVRNEYDNFTEFLNPTQRLVVLVAAQALGKIVDIVANQPFDLRHDPDGIAGYAGLGYRIMTGTNSPDKSTILRPDLYIYRFVGTEFKVQPSSDFRTLLGGLVRLNYLIDYNEKSSGTFSIGMDPGKIPPGMLRAYEESPRARAIFTAEEFLEIPHRQDLVHLE